MNEFWLAVHKITYRPWPVRTGCTLVRTTVVALSAGTRPLFTPRARGDSVTVAGRGTRV